MPEGVEHPPPIAPAPESAGAVLDAVMPEGVEHEITSILSTEIYEVLDAVMPEGVEHR